jgi:type IX secretion system PorP/SprF family membrane protein
LSLGLLMLSDQSGNGILKENHLGLSAAYTKGLDRLGKQSITAGFQGSFSSLGFDQNKANFEDEISASGFTLPSSEVLLTRDLGRQYLDMHAGLLYKGSLSENDLFYAGASVYHLNTPSLGFSSPQYFIQRRYTVHGGGYIGLGYATTVHASFQYQQQFNYKEFVLGGAISQLLVDKQKTYTELYAGAWIRNNDAIIPYLGIEWNSIRAGFSYDINYSNRKAASALYQSAEISFNWIFNIDEGALTVKCPKF